MEFKISCMAEINNQYTFLHFKPETVNLNTLASLHLHQLKRLL
jgi:hypothetical protein